jgi:predicted transcriptional regulator
MNDREKMKEEIIKCRKKGMTYMQIVNKCNLKNKWIVKDVLTEYRQHNADLPKSNAFYSDVTKSQAIRLYENGISREMIAKLLGVKDATTITKWIKSKSWSMWHNYYMDDKELNSYIDKKTNKIDFDKIPKDKIKEAFEELEFQRNCALAIKKVLDSKGL